MKRAVGTLLHEEGMDWGPGMLALAETLSTHSAFLYRYNAAEPGLSLISCSSDEEDVPSALPADQGLIREILLSKEPFYNETVKFGESFSGFTLPYLAASSLQYEKRILGLLLVSMKKMPSRQQLDFLSAKALHFSLLLAIQDAEQQTIEWRQKSQSLEQKLNSAYQRIRESDKLAALGQFAGGLAHEFNTPLAAVQTYAEYLQLFVKGEAEQESLEGILKATAHCRDIVENVLRLSRDGRREFERIALSHVLHDAMALTEPEMQKRKIAVSFEMIANPVILGNHTRLVQVMTNLLNNARDSIGNSRLLPRKGAIKIVLTVRESNAVIEVADNGPGIPRNILGQVFNPFFTTKEIGQGTGLGLSICHAIIHEHSGTIEILSEEGQGTMVVVKISLAEKP